MRNVLTAGVVSALLAVPTQLFSQSLPPSQQSSRSGPGQAPPNPAKPVDRPAAPAKPVPQTSTPELRSAAELALSSEPVFDNGTYLRIKQTLLSYSDIQVRGGWPSFAADAKL